MKKLWFILACIIFPLLGSAQQNYTRTYTVDDGLPSNQVNCLYQDSTGYLWIGTDAGIGVFDGIVFKIISKRDGLASNDVRAITQDESGNFWFACYDGGLTRFDGSKFTSYTTKNGLHSNFIRRLYYSRTYRTLFVGANDGFYTLKDGRFEFYGKANGKLAEEHEILWFLEAKGFVYVFPFKDYLLKFYPETKEIRQRKEKMYDSSTWCGLSSAVVTSNGDTIWNGLIISTKTGIKRFHPVKSGLAFNLSEDDGGNVWIPVFGSIVSGILRYNGVAVDDYTEVLGLDEIKLNYLLFDRKAGILWMASEQKGLIAYPTALFSVLPRTTYLTGKHDFHKLQYFSGIKYIVYQDIIVKLLPDGTKATIPISLIESYNPAQDYIRTLSVIYKAWRTPQFNEITQDNEGSLWLSTTAGLLKLDKENKKISRHIIPKKYFRFGNIAFNDKNELFNWGYWIDTLSIFREPNNSTNLMMQHFSSAKYNLPKEITRMLPFDGNMLFSSRYGGLYLYDNKTFVHLNKTCPGLSDDVSDICQDLNGNIVYCTNTGEVRIGTITGGRFVLKFRMDSLYESYGKNFIWLICDKANNLYVGTNRGMLLVNLPKLYANGARDIRFYSASEGYSDYSVTSPILDDDGNVWLASQKNLVKIDVKAISSRVLTKSTVVLTRVETTDSVYVFANGLGTAGWAAGISNWKFPYRSNNFTFHFNSINLLNADKDLFSVKLEGFDKSFKEIGSERKATYTNLPPGNYRLMVRVHNLNSQQGQTQCLFEFKVQAPYWQTWWFYVFTSLMLIAVLWIVYYTREQRLKKETLAKLENAELEMQALQSQMNPHFVFNVMNSLQRYILERDAHNGVKLLSDFSSMIRQTFSLASKKIITLQEEITYLESYLTLEQERFAHKFQFEITASAELNLTDTMIPSMLIQPMVENAVKHGLSPLEDTDGMLTVRFSIKDKASLQCTIEDNGIGLERSLAQKKDNTTHLSKALGITRRRIELLSRSSKTAKYSVAMMDRKKIEPGKTGTIVTIILPIQLD